MFSLSTGRIPRKDQVREPWNIMPLSKMAFTKGSFLFFDLGALYFL